MGYDDRPWGSTGFQPRFNLTYIENDDIDMYRSDGKGIVISNFETKTKRIPYPVIRKEKVKIHYDFLITKKEIKYLNCCKNCDTRIIIKIKKSDLIKLDLDKLEQEYKTIYRFNSLEIKPDIIQEETGRITKEQAEKYRTLEERYFLYKEWDMSAATKEQLNIL